MGGGLPALPGRGLGGTLGRGAVVVLSLGCKVGGGQKIQGPLKAGWTLSPVGSLC